MIWQLPESSATKAENLENYFMDATSKAKDLGWSEGKKKRPKMLAGTERRQRLAKYYTFSVAQIQDVSGKDKVWVKTATCRVLSGTFLFHW